MAKNNNRQGRIDEEYRKELSQIISYELPMTFVILSIVLLASSMNLKDM